ncbi:MAG: AAA family ATPase [Clostridia bacterium]|jgi:cell division protease FtsH|nr:AAA family ATPase [Clostridia bacterium]
MSQEIILGVVLAVAVFFIISGYNVVPLLVLFMLGSVLYIGLQRKGLVNSSFFAEVPAGGQINFTDVGGQATAINELMEAMNFINEKDKIGHLGIRPLKGILLTGPPGTGKTLLAKAAATYTDSLFFATSGSEFVEMYAGVGAQRVRNLFRQARKKAKQQSKRRAIIFIDEIEVLGAKRGSHANHMEYDQTLNQLLVEMDGLEPENDCQILVIAATNRVDMIDAALLRPGRFDRIVQVQLPDKEGRLQILQLHTKNKPLGDDVALEAIAKDTFGFSGAHLESLANEAAIMAFREGQATISQRHFKEAIDKVMLGEKLERKPGEQELQRVAIHETGHALISELERPGSVAHVTIVPRGQAMGYMRQSPEQDSYMQTKTQLESQIRIALAGAVAEELILQEKSTGAANDIKEAIKLAKRLIACGLSELGIVDGEQSGDLVSGAVRSIIAQQEQKVKQVLSNYRLLLQQVASLLRQEENLSGEELRAYLQHFRTIA